MGPSLCLAIQGSHGPSETQQAHHPNAQPLRWLRAARRTRMKKPRRSGAKSTMRAAEKSEETRQPTTVQYHSRLCSARETRGSYKSEARLTPIYASSVAQRRSHAGFSRYRRRCRRRRQRNRHEPRRVLRRFPHGRLRAQHENFCEHGVLHTHRRHPTDACHSILKTLRLV